MTIWDQDSGNEVDDESAEFDESGCSVYVNGSYVKVDIGTSFIESIKSIARDAGLGKFRVLVDGEEIEPDQAPDTFTDGLNAEIRPYDVAGN